MNGVNFSALQRAEIAENVLRAPVAEEYKDFSALQRAEIAENRPPLHSASLFHIPITTLRRS